MDAKISFTNTCNAQCTTCLVKDIKGPKGMMPVDVFKGIVDKLYDYGIETLHMYNIGESYLHPSHMEMFDYGIEKFKHKTVIITNGAEVDLIPEGVGDFIISFNGGNETVYEGITKLNFLETTQNIMRLYREGYFDKVAGTAEIHMLVTDDNRQTVEDFKSLFASITDKVSLRLSYKYDNQCGQLYECEKERIPCNYHDIINVHPDGRVIMCAHDFEGVTRWGDLKVDSVEEIVNNGARRAKKAQHADGIFSGLCSDCNYNVKTDGSEVEYVAGPRSES